MKTTVYLRIARNLGGRSRHRFAADARPSAAPLMRGDVALPTIAFAVDLTIPDELFDRASTVIAELKIPEEQATIAAEVTLR